MMKRIFQLLLVLMFYFNISYANVPFQSYQDKAALCQQLRSKIQSISNNMDYLYETESAMARALINVLIINNMDEGSISKIQNRHNEASKVAQNTQLELQDAYNLVCSY